MTIVDWIILIWFLGGFGWVGRKFAQARAAARQRVADKREHELAVKRLELQIARGDVGEGTAVAARVIPPGPCEHLHVTPVVDAADDVVAWLCKNPTCEAQLPANWAVRQQDLQ